MFAFNYPNQDMTKINALKFEKYLENLAKEFSVTESGIARNEDYYNNSGYFYPTETARKDMNFKVNLIGHSNGGLVSRYYIENLGHSENVEKLITIDTPHWGSGLAYAADPLTHITYPMDTDLKPDSPIYGGDDTYITITQWTKKGKYIENNLTDELQYWNKGNTKYYFLAGYDLDYSELDDDLKKQSISFEIKYSSTFENMIFGNFRAYLATCLKLKYGNNELNSINEQIEDMNISNGDNVVDISSQLGIKFKEDETNEDLDNEAEKIIQADFYWINLDTIGGHNSLPNCNFHSENQKRTETTETVIKCLEDK